MDIDAELLTQACGDGSLAGGMLIRADLDPLGGAGFPVKPAIYSGGVYQGDWRWLSGEQVEAVVIDNVPSQANRLEAALERVRDKMGLPEIVLDLSDCGDLPPHLPRRISSLRFPHRQADAYVRDSLLDGAEFKKTPIGVALVNATADYPHALLQWMPQALLLGFWQSHLGSSRSQAKLARSWVSEIVGYRPATATKTTARTRTLGTKGDPLNLNGDDALKYDKADVLGGGWSATPEKRPKDATEGKLSNIGHGQVPFKEAELSPAAISFGSIAQQATLSIPDLRRVWVGDPRANAAARAMLCALGIAAHVAAFTAPFTLRSGCALRRTSATWTWLGATADEQVEIPTLDQAIALWHECVQLAEDVGLPVGSRWSTDTLVLTPNQALQDAIRKTWPLGEWA
jgi:CRISPR-associated protein Csb1